MSVIITVFAGRRGNLEILLKYCEALHTQGLISELHFWNFTRDNKDETWLKTNTFPSYVTIQNVNNKSRWLEYYKHYTLEKYPDHVIIKCDDDVIYMDIDAFKGFIQRRIENPEYILAFPSIVNNGVCAYYQQVDGLIPTSLDTFPYDTFCGKLWLSGSLCMKLHEYFIESRKEWQAKAYTLDPVQPIKIGDRISINCFAILSKDLPIFQSIGNDDELELTVNVSKREQRAHYIDKNMTVSHLSFYKQREKGFDESKIRQLYNEI